MPNPRPNTLSAKALREPSRERMSLVVPTSLMQEVLAVAADEHRTLSATVLTLVREALHVRANGSPVQRTD